MGLSVGNYVAHPGSQTRLQRVGWVELSDAHAMTKDALWEELLVGPKLAELNMDDPLKSRPLKLDDRAASADPSLPAFLARPAEAPVYHGFPIIAETMTDGWVLGVITEYADVDGCEFGDAFVVAPDGSRAGLVWNVGEGDPIELSPCEEARWGVYEIFFPRPIRTTEDLVLGFRAVLPQLQRIFEQVKARGA